jgi:hypothetical protein
MWASHDAPPSLLVRGGRRHGVPGQVFGDEQRDGDVRAGLPTDPKFAVVVQTADALAQAGRHQPTRLQIDRRIRVDLNDRRFMKNRQIGTARLGSLSTDAMQQLIECYAALPAVADDAERVGIHPQCTSRPIHRQAQPVASEIIHGSACSRSENQSGEGRHCHARRQAGGWLSR